MNKKNQSDANDPDKILQAKITSTSYVYIQSVNESVPLSEPIYAINWFNTKNLWLYNFYNLLASISVKSIGGKAFFKGRSEEVLMGDRGHHRDVLLIVNYPNANQFKKMLESTYFKLVSLLRMLAVKRFTFGFTKRTDLEIVPPLDSDMNSSYAIHHYKGNNDIAKKVEQLVLNSGVNIHYAGRISSLLFSGDKLKANKQVNCLMDGLILLKADSSEQLKNLVKSENYQAIIGQTESSFITTLNRML